MKIILFTFLIAIALTSHADDMNEYMNETLDLINMEEYEEALERTIWFHNHVLEHDESMTGVRLSFALMYWNDFGKKYPPALAALKNIRDENTNKLISGGGSPDIFQDTVAINDELSGNDKSIELFKTLDKKRPDFAKRVWHYIDETVLKEKEYTLAAKYTGDVHKAYQKQEQEYLWMVKLQKEHGSTSDNDFKETIDRIFVDDTLKLIHLATALDDRETAIKVQNAAKAIVKDIRLDESIINK